MTDQASNADQETDRLSGQLDQRLSIVLHALEMVRGLPTYAAHDSQSKGLPGIVRVACLEDFYVNVRLLAEFLARKPKSRHITAKDFVSGRWSPESPYRDGIGPFGDPAVHLAVKRLREVWWPLASAHVVHLGDERLVQDGEPPEFEDTSLTGLNLIVSDIELAWKAFELASGLIELGHDR